MMMLASPPPPPDIAPINSLGIGLILVDILFPSGVRLRFSALLYGVILSVDFVVVSHSVVK